MSSTIFIKFCVFIVHSKPNNMTLSAFPGKIPETGKIYLKFFLSPNAGPKPIHQSRSKSISRVVYKISRANNVILANFPGKIPETGKIYLNFFRPLSQGLTRLINLVETRYIGFSCKYF